MLESKNKYGNMSGRETLKSQKRQIIITMGHYSESKEENGGLTSGV